MVERERVVEAGVAIVCVLVMLGVMMWIGDAYGADNGLSEEGATALVAAIVGFILLLLAVGVGFAFAFNEAGEGPEPDDADAEAA